MNKTIAFLICLIFLYSNTLYGSSFRCDGGQIRTGDFMYKIQKRCGPPLGTYKVGEKKYIKDDGVEKILYLVEWVYEKGGGYYIITFEGSRAIKVEYEK